MHRTPEESAERARKEMKNAAVVMTVTFVVVILIGLIYWVTHRYLF